MAIENSGIAPHHYATLPVDAERSARVSGLDGRPVRLWDRVSLRWQILSAFFIATLLAGIVAAVVTVYDARRAAELEIAASMRLAERVVVEAIGHAPSGGTGSTVLANLARELDGLRHVRVLVTGDGGGMASLLPSEDNERQEETVSAPAWFTSLVRVNDVRREMRIGLSGHQIGSVVLIGHAGDEIAEVWKDSKNLAAVALALNAGVAAILYVALGRVLRPLINLGEGLEKLERGQFQYRLARSTIPELANVAGRFNALADRLAAAKAENSRLTTRLITVQDDERHHIATELHDEIGPCLFGLKANIASLDQFADDLPPASADRMRERAATLGDITDKIQMLNRRLLNRVRPMALGHVPLTDLVTGLVADFERLNTSTGISLALGVVAHSYGDSIDLTVYRCLQEGITNAKRHGEARTIAVELDEIPVENGLSRDASSAVLHLSIRDDGHGFAVETPWGFGLTGMEERVRALGGTLAIVGLSQRGTTLTITIPFDKSRVQTASKARGRQGTNK
ncbi:ATP-binding protein [Sinorhizobium sp. BG8]|uniref:ATP-binding protein n=1 Tax=Sinorhizobium sp. BG8 TaxID=2613773 RepID=UPI00193E7B5E|nr:ATP-binding protein [Sinorhizobium sp. BG8]QRM55225.1 hypothetical protein F3Y30_12275 [Sinorhizobium sp. BG8]